MIYDGEPPTLANPKWRLRAAAPLQWIACEPALQPSLMYRTLPLVVFYKLRLRLWLGSKILSLPWGLHICTLIYLLVYLNSFSIVNFGYVFIFILSRYNTVQSDISSIWHQPFLWQLSLVYGFELKNYLYNMLCERILLIIAGSPRPRIKLV